MPTLSSPPDGPAPAARAVCRTACLEYRLVHTVELLQGQSAVVVDDTGGLADSGYIDPAFCTTGHPEKKQLDPWPVSWQSVSQ